MSPDLPNPQARSDASTLSRSDAPRSTFLLERIIEASARNAFLIIVLTAFAVGAAIWALTRTPLDAIPDLSDVQVIVYTDWEGRSPDLVEDQITYPVSSKFIAAPKVKFVRGESMFGKSFVYVIFQDGTDIYWARARFPTRRRESRDRTRRHGCGLGLRVRARR